MWTIFRTLTMVLLVASISVLFTRGTKPALIRSVAAPQVPIADLIANGERYSDTLVRVTGQVVPSTRFSFFGFGGFQLRDATGATVFVLSRGQGLPSTGSTATILGSLKPIVQAGTFNYPVLLQE